MKTVYIVYWVLWKFISVPCPDKKIPKYDEFGRITNSMELITVCGVAHYKRESDPHSKKFNSKDSAFAFYQKALTAGMDSVRIDSIRYGNIPKPKK